MSGGVAIETQLTTGARYYLLLLVPHLVKDMEQLGLPRIIHSSGFPEHELTSLYFEFLSVCRVLPEDPKDVAPELWEYLVHCTRLMSTLVNAASRAELSEARESAVRKFLPHARETVKYQYQEQCQEGTVEFRLAHLLQGGASPDQSRELCKEAIRLEREERVQTSLQVQTEGLSCHQAAIVEVAKDYVRESAAGAPEEFCALDLVVRLLDLLHEVLPPEPGNGPAGATSVERIVLGLGHVLFSRELGLGVAESEPLDG